jgi:hypothetical protein
MRRVEFHHEIRKEFHPHYENLMMLSQWFISKIE